MNKVIGGAVMIALGWWILGNSGNPNLAGINIGTAGSLLILGGLAALVWGAFSSGKKKDQR
jgi:hypothetical protein